MYLPRKWGGCRSSIGWCGPGWGQWRWPWRPDTCPRWWYRSAPPRTPPLYNRSWTGSCLKMSYKQNQLLAFTQKIFCGKKWRKLYNVNYYLKKRLLKIINPYGTSIFTGKNFLWKYFTRISNKFMSKEMNF